MREKSSISQADHQRHMRGHVEAQQQSGLSRAEYCRLHNLSYHALAYWCRKAAGKVKPPLQTSSLVPVPISQLQNPPFSCRSDSGLRLRLAGNVIIEIDNNFSQATLRSLLSVLEQQ